MNPKSVSLTFFIFPTFAWPTAPSAKFFAFSASVNCFVNFKLSSNYLLNSAKSPDIAAIAASAIPYASANAIALAVNSD
ncbi:MAG: hypothetical protein E7270_02095 [Lachnospiraceae bacterium]|nr:hypothetical protein [Lachnospiraceae bacterium]